jgi:hypothetical protein
MTGVGTYDGKSLEKSVAGRFTSENISVGRFHIAVNAAIALIEKTAAPAYGQSHLKTDGIVFSVHRAYPLIHGTTYDAMIGHGGAIIPAVTFFSCSYGFD